MMKSADAPRRIYSRNGIIHVCFEGQTFGPVHNTSSIDVGSYVTCEPVEDTKKVKVTFRKPKKAGVVEFWVPRDVPVKHRG